MGPARSVIFVTVGLHDISRRFNAVLSMTKRDDIRVLCNKFGKRNKFRNNERADLKGKRRRRERSDGWSVARHKALEKKREVAGGGRRAGVWDLRGEAMSDWKGSSHTWTMRLNALDCAKDPLPLVANSRGLIAQCSTLCSSGCINQGV